MTIYTMCVDQERGRYLAVSASEWKMTAVSYCSADEAVGLLVKNNPGITIDAVHYITTDEQQHPDAGKLVYQEQS